MRYTLCIEENYKNGNWMGGTTKELAIFPRESQYLDRNFIWRLSSATVDTEESDFSRLPDYDRVLMVLEGEAVLSYEGQRVARLTKLEQDRFDGAWKTKSFGKITDFNLMVRKGNEGYLDLLFPESESQDCVSTQTTELPKATHGLYCLEGYCVVTFGKQTQMLRPGQLLVLEYEKGETLKYSVMGEGTVIRSQIFYDDMTGEIGPEIIPPEKATFDDFKKCVYLANIQFRWAKYMVKSLKTTWFDQELSKAIRKAERFFLPTMIFFAGVLIGGIVLMEKGVSEGVFLAALLAWLVLDCLLVSPLIYMAVTPKPIRKHIKNISDLTPYEQKVREAELGRNEQAENVLRKYKNSGKPVGK